MVEDTSLYLDSLGGLPGPLIKWFLKALGSRGLYQLAERNGDTRARATTVIGVALDASSVRFYEGTVDGRLVEPRGRDIAFGRRRTSRGFDQGRYLGDWKWRTEVAQAFNLLCGCDPKWLTPAERCWGASPCADMTGRAVDSPTTSGGFTLSFGESNGAG